MNRHQRRAQGAKARHCPDDGRAEAIAEAMRYLALQAASTATGATIFHPDGTRSYVDADDARALYGGARPRGCA